MDLNEQHLRATSEETETPESVTIQISIEEILQKLSEKVLEVEKKILELESPTLMYRRPSSTEHEKLAETLDYLHNSVEELKRCQSN